MMFKTDTPMAHRVLEIPAQKISAMKGEKISDLRLVRIDPISKSISMPVWQMNEVTTSHVPYTSKVDLPSSGVAGTLDADDRLVVELKSAGIAATPELISSIKKQFSVNTGELIEVQVPLENNEFGYFYLFKAPHAATPKPVVTYKKGLFKTPYYSVQLDPENPINWGDFWYEGFSDSSKKTILDTMKIRMDGGVFTKFTPLRIDNDNLRSEVLDIIEGDLSTTIVMQIKVVVAGIRVMRLLVYFEAFPERFSIHAHADIPSIAKSVLVDPNLAISLDGNNLEGSRVQVAGMPGISATIDGTLSDEEKSMQKTGINPKQNWIWFSTGKNFDLFSYMEVPDNFPAEVSLEYQDDKTKKDKPERFVGASPNVGYLMTGLPAGQALIFHAHLYFLDKMPEANAVKFADVIRYNAELASKTYPIAWDIQLAELQQKRK